MKEKWSFFLPHGEHPLYCELTNLDSELNEFFVVILRILRTEQRANITVNYEHIRFYRTTLCTVYAVVNRYVSLPILPSQAVIASKRLDRLSWF